MTTNKMAFRSLLMAFAFGCCTLSSQAQGPGDPGDDPDPSQNIPFDGGISLVVAAGIAYAAKKGYDKRKRSDTTTNS